MKKVQKFLLHPYPIILRLLALFFLVGAGVSLLPRAVSAHGAPPPPPTLTPATYICTISFLSGPVAGKTQQATLVFNADGTMTATGPIADLAGAGYWWIVKAQNGPVGNFSFQQPLPAGAGATDINTVQTVTSFQNAGKSFSTDGYGLAYNGNTFAYPVHATTQCNVQ
ncbi:MAG TPA: hypothetical protein VH593_18620 [Ktedonobacteraceae bacterium]|jgi:hypothetical protein